MWMRVKGLVTGLELLFWVLAACIALVALTVRFTWILITEKQDGNQTTGRSDQGR